MSQTNPPRIVMFAGPNGAGKSTHADAMHGTGERILDSVDEPNASLEALWAKEADDRLAAYRRGEIRPVALSDVIAKYQITKKPA